MQKWKIAFWCCLTLLVLLLFILTYPIIDQAYTLTYHKVGFTETEDDFDNLLKIINETDLLKTQIINLFKKDALYEFMVFKKDSVSFNQISLIF